MTKFKFNKFSNQFQFEPQIQFEFVKLKTVKLKTKS